MAQFKPNRRKIVEALVYLAIQRPGIGVFHANKTLFFADRAHLLRYGRTITGDIYYAMDDGPVPTNAYDIARNRDRFVTADVLAYAAAKLSLDDSGSHVQITAKDNFDDSEFSQTDIECLQAAIDTYADMEFLDLWRLAHAEQPWKDHYRGKGTSTQIPIESFIPPDMADRDKVIEQLREHATYTEI